MSDQIQNLRERILRIQKHQNGFNNRNIKKNNACQFKPGHLVLYNNQICRIIENNSARGHNHLIQNEATSITYSIINCTELTLLQE